MDRCINLFTYLTSDLHSAARPIASISSLSAANRLRSESPLRHQELTKTKKKRMNKYCLVSWVRAKV